MAKTQQPPFDPIERIARFCCTDALFANNVYKLYRDVERESGIEAATAVHEWVIKNGPKIAGPARIQFGKVQASVRARQALEQLNGAKAKLLGDLAHQMGGEFLAEWLEKPVDTPYGAVTPRALLDANKVDEVAALANKFLEAVTAGK